MSNAEHGALAETMWRFTELVPWLGGANGVGPDRGQLTGAPALRRLQDEQQRAIEAHLAMMRSAVEHASQSTTRLVTARNPMDAAVAQAGFGLAMAELAAAPARAWLEIIPRLHACCMTMANDTPDSAPAPGEAETASPGVRASTRTPATRGSEPT